MIVFSLSSNAQRIIIDSPESIIGYDRYSKSNFGFSNDIPSYFSIEKYVPPVQGQGRTGSCVGWSTTYYALSTIYNNFFEITSFEGKRAHSFDPWFTYSLVTQKSNRGSKDCQEGLRISTALDVLTDVGPKKILYPPYLGQDDCNKLTWSRNDIRDMSSYTDPYKLKKFEIADPSSDQTEILIKTEISKYGFPVVIGISKYSSNSINNVGTDGIFNPVYDELGGGHAMTIVGYDDYKNGGSYRIVNSWGDDWGDNGYCWMKYSDFKKFGFGAYFFWINEDILKPNSPQLLSSDYIRTDTKSGKIYEGQTYNSAFTGYGILSDDNTFFVGPFKNGLKNGHFKIVDDEGFWYANYKNGEFIKDGGLGFASNGDNAELVKQTKKFLSFIFGDVKVNEFID